MLFSVSTGVWERDVQDLKYVGMLNYIFQLWAISPLFPLFYISLPGETRKEEVGYSSLAAWREPTPLNLKKNKRLLAVF